MFAVLGGYDQECFPPKTTETREIGAEVEKGDYTQQIDIMCEAEALSTYAILLLKVEMSFKLDAAPRAVKVEIKVWLLTGEGNHEHLCSHKGRVF